MGEERKTVRFGMGGDEEHVAFLFFFGFSAGVWGFRFLNGETEGRACSLAQFVYFYEGVLMGETIRGGIAIADGQVRYVVTSKSSR
jgi:hypothetical protein